MRSLEVPPGLLRTSVLDRVNGELADLLTGATGSERILLDLEDANAFVVSLDPGRTWFRYHRMFGGLLRLELRRTMPADIAGLHQLAARGQAADALGHLQAAGDRDEAARMLAEHALSLTLDGQAGTVAALLRSFPARTGEDSPDLSLVRAIAYQYQIRLDQTVTGAPAIALDYPWTHLISGHLGRVATRADVAMHQQYIADIEASSREALASVNPGPIFKHYGENVWAAVRSHLDAVTDQAAAPVIAKYTGVLGGADIEIFTRTTAFAIMQSIRLDRGPSGPVHP